MLDFSSFFEAIPGTGLEAHSKSLQLAIEQHFKRSTHGRLEEWLSRLDELPDARTTMFNLTSDRITIDTDHPPDPHIVKLLKSFQPWRKGPFQLLGIPIDTEWRSDWKWQRLAPHIRSLKGATVLDVGCGNGYHCWRMRGAEAELVVGTDPTMLFLMQFQITKRYLDDQPVFLLPLRSEEMPGNMAIFDSVFSMGVLYHRRSPMDHLDELRQFLKPGGQLVLETLVIESGSLLMPEDRYARMRNVWFIPSAKMLETWVRRAGFRNVRTVDITRTTVAEQHATEWMNFQSLPDFLDPDNDSLTIEGYPAPVRAIITADK